MRTITVTTLRLMLHTPTAYTRPPANTATTITVPQIAGLWRLKSTRQCSANAASASCHAQAGGEGRRAQTNVTPIATAAKTTGHNHQVISPAPSGHHSRLLASMPSAE